MNFSIPFGEWQEASSVANFVGTNQSGSGAYVYLTVRDNHRTWLALGESRAIRIVGGEESDQYSLNLPRSLWNIFRLGRISEDLVRFDLDDTLNMVNVSCGPVSYTFQPFVDKHPAAVLDWEPSEPSTVAWLDCPLFYHVVMANSINPVGPDGNSVEIWFGMSDDSIKIGTSFAETGNNWLDIAARREGPDLYVKLMTETLVSVVSTMSLEIECKISVPKYSGNPVVFEHGDVTVLAMPRPTEFESAQSHVEAIINDTVGWLSVVKDDDGDYPLRRHGLPIYGRLVEEESNASVLQVFAVVLDEVEETPELLREINSLNAGLKHARIMHVDFQVLAEVDLVASSLDNIELMTAIDRIQHFANSIAPTLQIVHFGKMFSPPEELRWAYYRQTRVQAEILPQQISILNGPDAIKDWPFSGAVYVLTGWNPQGINRSGDFTNPLIAADILRADGRLVLGRGAAIEGDYSEPSLIAWNISLEVARDLGRRASQDAIFMIDADEMHLVACFNERSESWPRLTVPEVSESNF